MSEMNPLLQKGKPRRERLAHPSSADTPGIYRCPKCHGGLAAKPDGLVCGMCASAFAQAEGCIDFFLDDQALAKTKYPPALEHLYFSAEKILAVKPPRSNRILDLFFHRHVFNNWWASELASLKKTVQRYGTSEKRRVEFMVDDRSSENFIRQKINTEAKARSILKTVSALPHTGNRVLHVGCGGECNEALPAAYQKAGFVNFGVDAVRSYVKEFGAFGEAHLANASALPYAAAVFDVVNYTDILEHLFDPLRGLQEASRVLKKGGFLILETPNRSYLQRKNPLSWVEYGLVSLFPSLMRPRVITAAWEGEVLFHTEFSKREIMALLGHCGLTPVMVRTEVLRLSYPESAGSRLKRWAVLGLEKIAPTNKWLIVARKT